MIAKQIFDCELTKPLHLNQLIQANITTLQNSLKKTKKKKNLMLE